MSSLKVVSQITIASLIFFVSHSFFAADRIKTVVIKRYNEKKVRAFYRLVYNLFSISILILVIHIISKIPDIQILKIEGGMHFFMRLVQIIGLLIGLASFKAMNFYEFIGVNQIVKYYKENLVVDKNKDVVGDSRNVLITNGIFRIVRHPLYLAGLLILTFNPNITRTYLTISIIADLYLIFGALVEDKRNKIKFEYEYENYKKRVPFLLPACSIKKLIYKRL